MSGSHMGSVCQLKFWGPRSAEDQMSDTRLEIQIDHCQRSEVERSVREHYDPDLTGDQERGSEHEPSDDRLFNACSSLNPIMRQAEQRSADRDDDCLCSGASAENFAKLRKEKSAIDNFFAESASDNQRVNRAGKCCLVSSEIVVRVIYRIGAEQGHYDRLH